MLCCGNSSKLIPVDLSAKTYYESRRVIKMFYANCYNVMIASPSDVVKERDISKQIIHEWDETNSKSTGVVLLPTGWDINAYPSAGGPPQTIINRQVLDKADVLIGVFWTRIGTATAEHASGTIEEIDRHVESGKPTLLYFSSAPVVPDSIETAQYEALKDYKKRISNETFYHEYSDINDFEKRLSRHLTLLVQDMAPERIDMETQSVSVEDSGADKRVEMVRRLGDVARQLLIEASQDRSGHLLRVRTMGGLHVQTNGKAFGSETQNPKLEAELEEALNELETLGLISAGSYKREGFKVTAEGYRVAEHS